MTSDREIPTIPDDDSRPSQGGGGAAGERIGPYRLVEQIGEGGMGEVWLAEQSEPFSRWVALKLIKPGMDTRHVVSRFESERQVLALMDHPNIAKVIDAGSTKQGRPFFVMEYVPGRPITEYCDEEGLGTHERLELFFQVCDGVQHAHRNAIIHRDIKPHNVIVSVQGGKAVPKIIDFGIAKALDHQHSDRTELTEVGQLVGTPEYMSPEQAEMTGRGVDTRTDIYSLGVLLYVLLTGVLPFDPRRLEGAGLDEIRRQIREVDPPRPSTRIETMGGDSEPRAKARGTSPAKLCSLLRGDLDWITMKALEKEKSRRYGTPAELAEDLRRYLRSEPVIARPPSAAYRAQKFFSRHRLAVTSAALLLLLLIAFAATMGVQAGRIARERDRANEQAELARRESATAERVSRFLVDLFEVSDPGEARGNSITAREVLDKGARSIRSELGDQPALRGALMRTMGRVYESLGLYDDALPLLRDALALAEAGADEPELAACLHALGGTLNQLAREEEALPLVRRAVSIRQRVLSPDHPDLAESLDVLGSVLARLGEEEEAMVALREAARILESNPETVGGDKLASVLHNLAIPHYFLGEYTAAESLYLRSAAIEEKDGVEDNAELATTLHTLAMLYQKTDRLEEALQLELRSSGIRERVLGPDHYYVALSQCALGSIYLDLGRPEEAIAPGLRAIEIGKRSLQPSHGSLIWMHETYVRALLELGRHGEALSLMDAAMATIEAAGDKGALPRCMDTIAKIHLARGEPALAEATYLRSIERHLEGFDSDPAEAGYSYAGLAKVYLAEERIEDAIRSYERALAYMGDGWGAGDPERIELLREFAAELAERGLASKAAAALAEADSLAR